MQGLSIFCRFFRSLFGNVESESSEKREIQLMDFNNDLLLHLLFPHLCNEQMTFLSRTCRRFRNLFWNYRVVTLECVFYLLDYGCNDLVEQLIPNCIIPDSWLALNVQQRLLKYDSTKALEALKSKNQCISDYATLSMVARYGAPKTIRHVVESEFVESKPVELDSGIVCEAILSGKVENLLEISKFPCNFPTKEIALKRSIRSDSIPMICQVVELYRIKTWSPDTFTTAIKWASYASIDYIYSQWKECNELEHEFSLFMSAIDCNSYDGIRWLIDRGYRVHYWDFRWAIVRGKYDVANFILRYISSTIDSTTMRWVCQRSEFRPLRCILDRGAKLTYQSIFDIELYTIMFELICWTCLNPSSNTLLVWGLLPFWSIYQVGTLLLVIAATVVMYVWRIAR
jgi:hypothetical protein